MMSTPRIQDPENVIQVKNLSKSFGSVVAVNDMSFCVKKGEIFGFLGPNGAGKTTTLSILEGLRKLDRGRVRVLGMDIDKNAKTIKSQIGVQLQGTSLLPDLTVFEQVQLFSRLYGYQHNRPEIMSFLERVGLDTKAAALPDHLSGGQKQRLALALALVNQPKIVFLDEPTTGLDPQSRRVLWDLIRELCDQDKTVVITTHYMEEAEALCHRVGIIDHGRLVALDTPGNLITNLAGVSSITTSVNLPLDEFQQLPTVIQAQHDGYKLSIQTRDVAVTLRFILDLAQKHCLSLNDLHIQQPNLEDVFLNLTGNRIRN
ncbi:MAG: ABC transporter ATP-binding protein [Ardenticatenaceae bacterium]|nr:ABC transporter ATP-binding protein [Ardenticatenaceae bacterium]